MADWLTSAYPWIKSLHIISVMAWMAGMLYLPRLFIYHADAEIGSAQSETFKVMERRLLRGIINPAMIASFVFGGLLLATSGVVDWSAWWIWAKLGSLVAMAGMHGLFARWRKNFEADRNTQSTRTFRIANEVPTVLMIAIVIFAVVEPG